MPRIPYKAPKSVSQTLLERAADRSMRRTGIQLPVGFLRTSSGGSERAPLARMVSGGRGGGVRLKLYLSLVLIATEPPHRIRDQIPARAWAEMLDLPDPEKNGARRISDALVWLDANKFLKAERQQGAPPRLALLSADGSGRPFVRPGGQYLTVPLDFWRNYWITAMSGMATALFMILLDNQGGISSAGAAPIVTAVRRQQYGFSPDSWTRATQELESLNLLIVGDHAKIDGFVWSRRRNTYWIDKDRLEKPPSAAIITSTPSESELRRTRIKVRK